MNGFDLALVAVIALSALTGFARGIVRALIGLVAWVVGLVAAVLFTPALGSMIPMPVQYPLVPYVIAFVGIFVGALIAGALVAWPLRALIHGAGLGFVDRGLGAIFGLARGAVIVVAFALLAGVTGLPAADWWQNALLARPLAAAALAMRPWLPKAWADRLDFSGVARQPEPATAPAQGKA